jgi:peptidoglycan/xylan/chitin deacetylase (PgdA/CDA1 family)
MRIPVCGRRPDGTVHWSFDPVDWIRAILTERYVPSWVRPITSRIPLFNYARLPHVVKGVLQRVQDPRPGRANPVAFPHVPFDDFVDVVRRLCGALAFGELAEVQDLWPRGHRAAVTLTHDVDTNWILDPKRGSLLREIVETETSLGFKGAWYVPGVQLRPARHREAIECLVGAGHELGSHGWNHDSKLQYLPASRQVRRMEKIRRRFDGLPLSGIRTPWYCRSPELSGVLTRYFDYDSSVPTASAFFSSVSNTGCCTLFPWAPVTGLVELPLTLPPDTALDRQEGWQTLLDLADRIVERGGVIVVILHPQPHQSATPEGLRRYFAFLRALAAQYGDRLWKATPAEIVRQYVRAIAPEGFAKVGDSQAIKDAT